MKHYGVNINETELHDMQDAVRHLLLSDAVKAFPRKAEELQFLLVKLNGVEQS